MATKDREAKPAAVERDAPRVSDEGEKPRRGARPEDVIDYPVPDAGGSYTRTEGGELRRREKPTEAAPVPVTRQGEKE